LPAAKVASLGWQDALPTFAGWRSGFGLSLAYAQTPAGPILPACVFTADTATIVLPPLRGGGELRGTLLGASSNSLQIECEPGAVVSAADLPSPLWLSTTDYGHAFTLRLPPSTAVRRLVFKLPAGSRPVFTRLQVQDQFAPP
jgi:hypothetical protein